jgi:ABC-2 type transport system permease protein
MSGPLILVLHSLKRLRTLLLAMGVLLGAFQVLLIVIAAALERTNAFASLGALLPPFARELLGPSATSFISFSGLVSQGYFHPVVVGSVVGISIAIATIPTLEIESGFIDLILSRPLARHWIITRSILVMLICAVALLAIMVTGTTVALRALGPKGAAGPAPGVILSLAVNLGLLMFSWCGIAMALGAASRRRSVAGTIAGLLALATFLLDYIARAWHPAEAVAWLSPFHYYNALELIMGRPLDPHHLWTLAGIATTGFALAYVLFARRDLSR